MNSRHPMFFSSVVLLIAIVACSVTSSPPATSTPAPTATPPPVVLYEKQDFSDPGCFFSESTNEIKFFIENNAFHVEILKPGWFSLSPCMDADILFTDFVVEVDATQIDGANQNLYGLMLRVFGYDRDFYVFGISGNGKYTLVYDHLDENVPRETIVEWKPSSAIKPGQATNHLKAVLIGNTIELYVNGTFLEAVQDDHLTAGAVGFITSSSSESGLHVSFKNLVVTEP